MGKFCHHHSGKTRTMALFGCIRRITLNVTCSNVTCYVHAKFQHCEHSNYFVILKKVGPRFCCRGQYTQFRPVARGVVRGVICPAPLRTHTHKKKSYFDPHPNPHRKMVCLRAGNWTIKKSSVGPVHAQHDSNSNGLPSSCLFYPHSILTALMISCIMLLRKVCFIMLFMASPGKCFGC